MRTTETTAEQSIISPAVSSDAANTAYIRYVVTPKEQGYAVCLADGTQLAVFPNRDAAYFTARQHNLEPHSVH